MCPTCNGQRIVASCGGTCPGAPATHSVNLGCLPATCSTCDGTRTATDWLTSAEAARLWPAGGIQASSLDPQHFEAAIAGSGLTIAQRIELHGEWREYAEEDGTRLTSRQLLWVSRLLRNRATYEERFGTDAYEAMLTGNLWGVYQMIGKLNPRIYVLTR